MKSMENIWSTNYTDGIGWLTNLTMDSVMQKADFLLRRLFFSHFPKDGQDNIVLDCMQLITLYLYAKNFVAIRISQ